MIFHRLYIYLEQKKLGKQVPSQFFRIWNWRKKKIMIGAFPELHQKKSQSSRLQRLYMGHNLYLIFFPRRVTVYERSWPRWRRSETSCAGRWTRCRSTLIAVPMCPRTSCRETKVRTTKKQNNVTVTWALYGQSNLQSSKNGQL